MKTFVLRFLMYLAGFSALTAFVFYYSSRSHPALLQHLAPENFPEFAPVVIGVVAACAFVVAGVHGLLDVGSKHKQTR